MKRKTGNKDNRRSWVKTICKEIKYFQFPLLLASIAILIYILCYFVRSGLIERDAVFRYHEEIPLQDNSDSLVLSFTYPRTLWFDESRLEDHTIVLGLQYTTIPTCTQAYTATLSFTPQMTSVTLLDLQNNPIASKFVLTPTFDSPVFFPFRIQRVLHPKGEPGEITPVLRLESREGYELLRSQSAWDPIEFESIESARLNRFWSLVWGPTTPLIGGAAGLMVLAVGAMRRQQERRLEAEKMERCEKEAAGRELKLRQKEIAVALDEIDSWARSFHCDISESTRCYVEDFGERSKRSRSIWKNKKIELALQSAWEENAPIELQNTVQLLMSLSSVKEALTSKKAEDIDPESMILALRWAYEHMDDTWKGRVILALGSLNRLSDEKNPNYKPGYEEYKRYTQEFIPKTIWREVCRNPWPDVLKVWPHISFWRDISPVAEKETLSGLNFLGLSINPFTLWAEKDPLLTDCYLKPVWWKNLSEHRTTIFVGSSGFGKSAATLFFVYESLEADDQHRESFPVYYPLEGSPLNLDSMAAVVAQTLLHYIATRPEGFLKCGIAGRVAMTRLLSYYVDITDLPFSLQQAGLTIIGEGAKALAEITKLAQNFKSRGPYSDYVLLSLLSEARPYDFDVTTILLDVQELEDSRPSEKSLKALFNLFKTLEDIEVFVKAFLPDVCWLGRRKEPFIPVIEMGQFQNSGQDLSTFLESRLARSIKTEKLTAWCEPDLRDLPIDGWLVNASGNTPGGLIRKGDELLRCIGKRQCLLTEADLSAILGPLPKESA